MLLAEIKMSMIHYLMIINLSLLFFSDTVITVLEYKGKYIIQIKEVRIEHF